MVLDNTNERVLIRQLGVEPEASAEERYLRNIKQKLFIGITFNKLEGVGRGEERATNIC